MGVRDLQWKALNSARKRCGSSGRRDTSRLEMSRRIGEELDIRIGKRSKRVGKGEGRVHERQLFLPTCSLRQGTAPQLCPCCWRKSRCPTFEGVPRQLLLLLSSSRGFTLVRALLLLARRASAHAESTCSRLENLYRSERLFCYSRDEYPTIISEVSGTACLPSRLHYASERSLSENLR